MNKYIAILLLAFSGSAVKIKAVVLIAALVVAIPVWAQNSSKEMRVVVSSQDSGGVTQNDFDLNFLNNLEAYTVERTKQKTKEILASRGYPKEKIDVTSEANYVESGPMKLAVIRMLSSDGSSTVLIHGIIGNELKRIFCGKISTERIPITYGTCADKIKEVFGIKIGS
jgi:hypothetical protein